MPHSSGNGETAPLLRPRPQATGILENHTQDDYLVELHGGDDPLSPQNSMSRTHKWLSAVFLGAMTFAATFSSAVFAAVGPSLATEMHTTPETIALATTVFVIGFAAGPIIMGPASEVYGRKTPLFLGYLAFTLFQIPVATAKDFRSLLLWRFLGGVASSGSPAIIGGYLADFLRPVERGIAIAIFAATTLSGPPVGAIVGAVLLDSPLGWRWAAWLSLIMGAVFGVLAFLIVPETYVPVLLKHKAQRLRIDTGVWAWHAKVEETPVTLTSFVTRYLSRPFLMLCQEPILILMTLYVSFTFGMIYFIFATYSFSFVRERDYSPLQGSLPLLGIVAGIILGSIYVTWYTVNVYSRKFRNGGKATPEDRLPPMILGALILPVGLFWFAATCSPSITPWPNIVSGVPIGAGIQIITLQSMAYVIDIYMVNANSAISGTVVVRSLLGGLFPLAAVPLYQHLGAQVATAVVGLVASVFFVVPVILYIYGPKVRSWSRYTVKQ
ncbi:major facilitator superfamily domain-containing protein [Diaporthe sp. PMI_573]|nr:major facilitator superfamily domain-containing protein [Diaporthaceae sp. PMI_573]